MIFTIQQVRSRALLLIAAYVICGGIAFLVAAGTSGELVGSDFAILLGPFTFVFLNPPGSWAFVAIASLAIWLPALFARPVWLLITSLLLAGFIWAILGVSGLGLQV